MPRQSDTPGHVPAARPRRPRPLAPVPSRRRPPGSAVAAGSAPRGPREGAGGFRYHPRTGRCRRYRPGTARLRPATAPVRPGAVRAARPPGRRGRSRPSRARCGRSCTPCHPRSAAAPRAGPGRSRSRSRSRRFRPGTDRGALSVPGAGGAGRYAHGAARPRWTAAPSGRRTATAPPYRHAPRFAPPPGPAAGSRSRAAAGQCAAGGGGAPRLTRTRRPSYSGTSSTCTWWVVWRST